MKTFIRRALANFGIEANRIPKNRYGWLRDLNINTVLDIGANTGQFATLIHKILPDCDIYSFEPLGDCFEELERHMHHLERFRAFRYALGERDDELEMHRSEFSPSSSLLAMSRVHAQLFPYTARTWVERVSVRTLDGVVTSLKLRDNVLIKIDVQGYEDRVIRGGGSALARAKALIVEVSFQPLYDSQPLFDSIYRMLWELGFRYAGSMEQLKNPVDGSVLQADAVFLRATNDAEHDAR
jgi:FkbM family methyltransferase